MQCVCAINLNKEYLKAEMKFEIAECRKKKKTCSMAI